MKTVNILKKHVFQLVCGIFSFVFTTLCFNTAWAQFDGGTNAYTISDASNNVKEPAQSPLSSTIGLGPVLINNGVFVPTINSRRVAFLNYDGTNYHLRQLNLITGQNELLASAPKTLPLQAPYTSQIISTNGDNVAYVDTNPADTDYGDIMLLNIVNNTVTQVGSTKYSLANISSISLKLFNNHLLVQFIQSGTSYLDVWNLNTNQSVRLTNCTAADINEGLGQIVYIANPYGTIYIANLSTPSSGTVVVPYNTGMRPTSVVFTANGSIAYVETEPGYAWSSINFLNLTGEWDTAISPSSNIIGPLVAAKDYLVWRDGNNIKAIKVLSGITKGISGKVITEAVAPSVTGSLSASLGDDRIVYTVNNVSASYAITHPNNTQMPMEQLRIRDLVTPINVPLYVKITGTGNGTITAYPASIKCANVPSQLSIFCTGYFNPGENVSLTVSPSTGTTLKVISKALGGISGSTAVKIASPITVTIPTPVIYPFVGTIDNSVILAFEFSGPNPDPVTAATNWINYFGAMTPVYPFNSAVVENIITQMNSSVAKLTKAQLAGIVPASILGSSNLSNLLTPAQLIAISANPLTISKFLDITKIGVAQSKIAGFNNMVLLGIAPTSSQLTAMATEMKDAVSFAEAASKDIISVMGTVFNDVTSTMKSALEQMISFQASAYNLLKNPPSYLLPVLAPLDPLAVKSLVNDAINQIKHSVKIYPSPKDLLLSSDPIMGPLLLIPGVGSEVKSIVNNVISTAEKVSCDMFCFGLCC